VLDVPPPPPPVEFDVVESDVGVLGVLPPEHANAPVAISTAAAAETNILFSELMMRFLIGSNLSLTSSFSKLCSERGDGQTTSWLKIRNPEYSQVEGRPELFGARTVGARSKSARPVLCHELQALSPDLPPRDTGASERAGRGGPALLNAHLRDREAEAM